ncbi:MAG: uroporphyrinogen decarboxylase family protein [Muribaculaceae bacterium]|nr:uroporphyrinogen decarboxylase family protein [Muribaculaceae bacterium]
MDKYQPDYRNILEVLYNRRPKVLPLYEHHIDAAFIEKATGQKFSDSINTDPELYFSKVINFWKENTYDAFDFEAPICEVFPDHGAILGGKAGPIQNREDFDRYPFDEIPSLFWANATPKLEAIRKVLPQGMKAYGGCGYGVFESAQDLVGYENLCIMQFVDPDLFRDLFAKIGDLYVTLWTKMVKEYSDIFVFFRMGDDLGHRTSTMLAPEIIKTHILPQHKKVVDIVHEGGKKFLLHSCGNIFSVMPDIIEMGIDAKHSNEDQIASYDEWIKKYNSQIGLFGGFDVNILSLGDYQSVYEKVVKDGTYFRGIAKGYGLGSGNSIPEYVSVDAYRGMIDAVKQIRRNDNYINNNK